MDSAKLKVSLNKLGCEHHKISELGYVNWHNWADMKTRQGHKQRQCPKCEKWLFKCEI